MRHTFALLLVLLAGLALAQPEGVEKGKIKKIDAEKRTITLTQGDKDHDYLVTDDTRIPGAEGKDAKDRLKTLKEGAEVYFKPERRDGKDVLVGLKPLDDKPAPDRPGNQIQRGKLKKLDVDKMTITLTQGDKDHTYPLAEDMQVLAQGKDLKERLKTFKEGQEVNFRVRKRDGKELVDGLAQPGAGGGGGGQAPPKVDTTKFKSLPELGNDEYHGYKGGLYADGKNERPAGHEKAGIALAKQVQPLDADGKPSADGKIVLLSVGMSNTLQASEGFGRLLVKEEDKNPHLVFVNGAQGGMTAMRIQDPEDSREGTRYWNTVDERLRQAGVTRAQVQAIWIKQADAGPSSGFPTYAKTLQEELQKIVQLFPSRFPNAKLVYLSSRTYGGYATTRLNPEPYAYESGFSVKWLIEDQLKGEAALSYDPAKGKVRAPWLSWGPYLWANGTTKNAAGLSYDAKDFGNDGTHPSNSGVDKVAHEMLRFFKTDSTTKPWFLR
jgi:Cu/Ag efflux protein CusF